MWPEILWLAGGLALLGCRAAHTASASRERAAGAAGPSEAARAATGSARTTQAAAGPARSTQAASPFELALTGTLPVDGPEHFQPSALLFERGRLLTVSDHDDRTIFELELGAASARARPYVTFEPPSAGPAPLDYEGLSLGAGGSFWILSEGRYRVLEVSPAGALPGAGRARWASESVESLGRGAGFFQVRGGDVEGLTRLPDGGALIAAERQPRGLIELGPGLELTGARAWAMPRSRYLTEQPRLPDFTDLTLVAGDVYALFRNAHLVVRLERSPDGWQEGGAWSFAAAENDARALYADETFGLAEGLALSDTEVFILLDNNEQPRRSAPEDRRALLFRFERP